MNNKEKIGQIMSKLNLPKNSYAVFGSGPLVVREWKDFHDLDLIVTTDIYNEWKDKAKIFVASGGDKGILIMVEGNEVEMFTKWWPGKWDIDKLIQEADVIDGIKFVKLDQVLKWKKMMGREKDLKDVEMIEKYLNDSK